MRAKRVREGLLAMWIGGFAVASLQPSFALRLASPSLLLSFHFTGYWLEGIENGVDNYGTARCCEESGAESKHTACRDEVGNNRESTIPVIESHVDKRSLPGVEHVNDAPNVLLGAAYLDLLYRF